MDELTTLQTARKDLGTLVEQKKKTEESEKYNAFLQEKANQLLGQCKVLSPEELAHSQNENERRHNTLLALRLLSTLQSELYMGASLNNFQKQVIALCKTQL